MRKTTPAKGAKAKADKYFSLIIRARGACQVCGKKTNLQCAHIISRRFSNTRCDFDNALCLCAGCHHRFTDHPYEFGQYLSVRIVPEVYEELTRRSQQTTKVDWAQTAARMQELWKQVQDGDIEPYAVAVCDEAL